MHHGPIGNNNMIDTSKVFLPLSEKDVLALLDSHGVHAESLGYRGYANYNSPTFMTNHLGIWCFFAKVSRGSEDIPVKSVRNVKEAIDRASNRDQLSIPPDVALALLFNLGTLHEGNYVILSQ